MADEGVVIWAYLLSMCSEKACCKPAAGGIWGGAQAGCGVVK